MREEGDNQVIKCSSDSDCDIAKSACCITSSKPIGGGEYTELVLLLHCSRDVHDKMYRVIPCQITQNQKNFPGDHLRF